MPCAVGVLSRGPDSLGSVLWPGSPSQYCFPERQKDDNPAYRSLRQPEVHTRQSTGSALLVKMDCCQWHARVSASNPEKCILCQRCAQVCPTGALQLRQALNLAGATPFTTSFDHGSRSLANSAPVRVCMAASGQDSKITWRLQSGTI